MNKPVILAEDTLVAPVVVDGADAPKPASAGPAFAIIGAIAASHLLNDLMQSLIQAVYPILKDNYALDFGQIGLITLAFMFTSSLLQPFVGAYTDKHPKPFSLALGMGFTLAGLLLLGFAHHYWVILFSAALVGTGSAIFHPEASRIARMASGGRFGMAQSTFQVGGNLGTAIGPVLAAAIIVPLGQPAIALFSVAAALAIAILIYIGRWYKPRIVQRKASQAVHHADGPSPLRTKDCARGAHGAAVLQDVLHGEHRQLLHVLPDEQVRRHDAGGADLSVPLPGRVHSRCVLRRSAG